MGDPPPGYTRTLIAHVRSRSTFRGWKREMVAGLFLVDLLLLNDLLFTGGGVSHGPKPRQQLPILLELPTPDFLTRPWKIIDYVF